MAEKLEMMSSNIIQENIDYIASKFPNALKEVMENGKLVKKIDFDVLKQELSTVVIDDKQERYQMTWPDKKKSILLANSRINATLRPDKEKSVDFDKTKNLYIEGDNLDTMKVLRETYLNKIDMIYIDPPYNTGNDFVYEDDFSETQEKYLSNSGQFDNQGNRLFANNETNGRFHTDWLNMIYPRLKISKDLLTDDGVIFASIDSNEVDNLKKVMIEIYGDNNYIGMIARRAKTTSFRGNFFAPRVDYILVFSKNKNHLKKFRGEVDSSQYNKIEKEGPRVGEYYGDDTAFYLSTLETRPNQRYFIECPDGELVIPPGKTIPEIKEDGVKVFPIDGDGVWRWEQKQYLNKKYYLSFKKTSTSPLLNQDGMKAKWNIYTKIYLKDKENDANIPEELFLDFINRQSTKELTELGIPFDFAKPVSLIRYLISIIDQKKDITILDFFSGSATTAHAVLKLNSDDEGNRKFIMIQLPEECAPDSKEYKAGFHNITEIGEERIRRAGKKIKEEAGLMAQNLDIGFRVLKLDSSNMKDVYYNPKKFSQMNLDDFVDNVKEDRTPLDLLFQVMLELGIELSAKIEEKEFNGKKYFVVNENDMVACFDKNINNDLIKELANINPIYAVFRDASFDNDSSNINCEQIFKSISPSTNIKVL